MADVVVTLKIMPESPDVDLNNLQEQAAGKVKDFSKMNNMKIEQVPVAFGLKSINIMFVMSEDIGATDPLEESISKLDGVNSVEVTDVRRTIG